MLINVAREFQHRHSNENTYTRQFCWIFNISGCRNCCFHHCSSIYLNLNMWSVGCKYITCSRRKKPPKTYDWPSEKYSRKGILYPSTDEPPPPFRQAVAFLSQLLTCTSAIIVEGRFRKETHKCKIWNQRGFYAHCIQFNVLKRVLRLTIHLMGQSIHRSLHPTKSPAPMKPKAILTEQSQTIITLVATK